MYGVSHIATYNPDSCDRGEKKNMDWMYKGPQKPEGEEYLLGRRIDKHIEEEDKVEENKGNYGKNFKYRANNIIYSYITLNTCEYNLQYINIKCKRKDKYVYIYIQKKVNICLYDTKLTNHFVNYRYVYINERFTISN